MDTLASLIFYATAGVLSAAFVVAVTVLLVGLGIALYSFADGWKR